MKWLTGHIEIKGFFYKFLFLRFKKENDKYWRTQLRINTSTSLAADRIILRVGLAYAISSGDFFIGFYGRWRKQRNETLHYCEYIFGIFMIKQTRIVQDDLEHAGLSGGST
ncbi:hypothetical protein ACJX0J_029844 [Zea mays]